MVHRLGRYLIGHWRGAQGFAWSFWVNLVLVRALIFAAQTVLGPAHGQDYHATRGLVWLLALVVHGPVFVWQAVGTVRAAERHVRSGGAMAPVWGAHLGLILSALWVLSYGFAAWQMTLPAPDALGVQTEREAARAARYRIQTSDDGQTLTLSGTLEHGITANLAAQIAAHPQARQIVLTSTGGNVFEARGLANLIRMHGLRTLVVAECSSACTRAFIGGTERWIAPGARLGFHQYRIDADYAVLTSDPVREQEKDRAAFLEAGVAGWFVDRMFASRAAAMWYPATAALTDAGVVTGVLPGPNDD